MTFQTTSAAHAAAEPSRGPSLRIGQLIESDGPGGAESVMLELCSELRQRGHDIHPSVFGGGEGWLSGRLKARGFEPFLPSISGRVPLDLRLIWEMHRWVKRSRLQVLHAHDFTMSVYAAIVGHLASVPYVISMHGGTYFATAAKRKAALRWAARGAAAFVGVSEATREHLATALDLSLEQVRCVPNGVPVPLGDRDRARQALGIAENERLLLAVGNLYPVKGHLTLIDAAGNLSKCDGLPPWRIAIAGRGELESSLRERISELGLEARIHLLGLRSDIGDLLAAADLWVMPSLSEGLPMALLEAMFAGLPIVASNVGGIPGVIRDSFNGMLVPPKDATALAERLHALLRGPDAARRLGEEARVAAQAEYSVQRMGQRYCELYSAAVARRV